MTRYLIVSLSIIIFILTVTLYLPRLFRTNKPSSTTTPILTAPSASPKQTSLPTQIPSPITNPSSFQEQINLQSQTDKDFAEKSKQIDDTYSWLNKLPIQHQNYYVYFDVDQKQFIAKLYPSSSSITPVDQQVENMKNEVQTKLRQLIPDFAKYNLKWDVKVE